MITEYEIPEITSALDEGNEDTAGSFIEAPLPIEKFPAPEAVSDKLAVLGLMTKLALGAVAVMFAFTLTFLEAVKVRVVFALQLTLSLIFKSPEPV